MGKLWPVLLVLALQVYAVVDLVRSDSAGVRVLPKWLWLVIVIIPIIGPVLWLVLGRPRVGPSPGGGGGGGIMGGPRPRGPVAPDDDPEFLKRLDEQSWSARMERLRRERESGGRPEPDSTPESGGGGTPATDGASDQEGRV